MEWSNEEMLQLIDEYRLRPVLWDPTHNLFKNRNKKEDAWKDLAKLFKTDTVEIKRKINSLLASFRREKQKVVLKPSGSGTEEIYKTKWFAFSSFGFLMDKNKPKHTKKKDEVSKILLLQHYKNKFQINDNRLGDDRFSVTIFSFMLLRSSK